MLNPEVNPHLRSFPTPQKLCVRLHPATSLHRVPAHLDTVSAASRTATREASSTHSARPSSICSPSLHNESRPTTLFRQTRPESFPVLTHRVALNVPNSGARGRQKSEKYFLMQIKRLTPIRPARDKACPHPRAMIASDMKISIIGIAREKDSTKNIFSRAEPENFNKTRAG
jgi:hypothetical protein